MILPNKSQQPTALPTAVGKVSSVDCARSGGGRVLALI